MKCLYLALMSLDPTGTGRQRWTNRWLSRHGARCWYCCRSVSRAARRTRMRLSTPRALHGFARQVGFAQGGDRAADMTWHYPA
jgi:hypothetical protein